MGRFSGLTAGGARRARVLVDFGLLDEDGARLEKGCGWMAWAFFRF
ncbi:MAG: hypothetical protein GY774_00400 [Planctomycetes bacterium]|nr:hypothetical protein [Planctomycetota bacterium]